MSIAFQTASISTMFALYLFQVGIGLVALLPFIPAAATGHDFFKTMSMMSFILILLGWGIKFFDHAGPAPIFATGQPLIDPSHAYTLLIIFSVGVGIYALTALIFKQLFSDLILIAIALTGVAALVCEALSYPVILLPAGVSAPLTIANSLTASLMGGGFLLNMLFGHWYLVEQGIPLSLLLRAANIMLAVVLGRVAIVCTTLIAASLHAPAVLARLMALEGHGIFFWERVGAGLAIPLVLAFMVRSTAKMGANQSATGLLYVGVAFAIMGELVARYLFLLTGLPL